MSKCIGNQRGLMFLLIVCYAAIASASFAANCSSQNYVTSCTIDSNNNNCATKCCQVSKITVAAGGSSSTTTTSICQACYIPATTISFQKYVKSTYGGQCDCGQVETTPAYSYLGYNFASLTLTFCNNQCCGSSGGGPDPPSSSNTTGIIIGVLIGVFVGVPAIVAIGVFIYLKFYHHPSPQVENDAPPAGTSQLQLQPQPQQPPQSALIGTGEQRLCPQSNIDAESHIQHQPYLQAPPPPHLPLNA